MAGPTVIAFGDPQAVKRWSPVLFLDTVKKSYWNRKFVSKRPTSVIQQLDELEDEAGDTITFDLTVQLRQKPTYGDQRLQGKEEALKWYQDQVIIDQMRHGVTAGGKMTRKRTLHNVRMIARDKLSDYWSRFLDELNFIYLSGSRGMNEDFIEDVTWAGHANNPIQAPDANHLLYGGDATAKNDLDAADKMTRALIERAAVKATMLQAKDIKNANMLPVMVDGEPHYVCLMSPFQEHDLRNEQGTSGWLEIQKALATAEGKANPIFRGGLGMINNVVLHSHRNVIRFSDYGAGADVDAGRALFLGQQAGVMAYGSKNGARFSWSEEVEDHGNEPVIAAGLIIGVKKTRFNLRDFGIISLDTAAADPNP